VAHRDQLAGVVLTNTAVSQPPGSRVPALIALAHTPGVLPTSCVRTPTFLRGTLRLARPGLAPDVRAGYLAPYLSAGRREAIGDFVGDIPLSPEHPSSAALTAITDGLPGLADVPVLLLWGPRDPVFSDRYLRDLVERLPQAEVHRYEGAGHLLVEDRDVAAAITAWLPERRGPASSPDNPDVGSDGEALQPPDAVGRPRRTQRRTSRPAIVELGPRPNRARSASRPSPHSSREVAAGLSAHGVAPGDRVALLVPPGADLAALVYACWRIGAVIVLADAGLGLRGMSRALRGAGRGTSSGSPGPWPRPGSCAGPARSSRSPATRIRRAPALGAATTLDDVRRLGRGRSPGLPPEPPARRRGRRPVHLRCHRPGQGRGLPAPPSSRRSGTCSPRRTASSADDRLVAAFAPFALYGPALGIASAVPDMDVTAPGTLTATALAEAAAAVDRDPGLRLARRPW
jgi:hypothetical protein